MEETKEDVTNQKLGRQLTTYSAEMKLSLLTEYRKVADTISISRFAREHDLSLGTFYGWMKKAADYFLRDRDSFLLFTRDGRAPLDNSEAERTVKPYALARRNFLFVRGKNGGDCSAIAMTMIQNAYINDIEPMSYLELLLTDAYKDNSGVLPWLTTTKDRIAAMMASKAERK